MTLKDFRRRCQYALTGLVLRVVPALIQAAPLAATRWLGQGLGAFIFLLPKPRRLILANLRVAFPTWAPAKARQVGRRSLQNLIQSLLEFIWFLRRPEQIKDWVLLDPTSRALMQRLVDHQRGVIVLSPHLGAWEMGFLAFHACGFPMLAVARQQPNPAVDALLLRARTTLGAKIAYERGAVRVLLKELHAKRLVALLVDQNTHPKDGGMFVPFFGLPAATSRAPAMLARRTGAPVICGTCYRDTIGRLAVHYDLVCEFPATVASDEELGAAINAVSERLIRVMPEQYLWLYKRWRYIPHDDPGPDTRFPPYAYRLDPPAKPGAATPPADAAQNPSPPA